MTAFTRRAVLRRVAGTVPVVASGCVNYQTHSSPSNSTGNSTADGDQQAEVSAEAFVRDLESQGIDVDSTMKLLGDVSLAYYHRPDHEVQDRQRIALTFVEYRSICSNLLSVTAIEPSGDTNHAVWHISRRWADQYAAGDLSKDQYLANVRDTWTKK